MIPAPDESLDRLAGDWRIFQLRKGHRFSTDDLLTAWQAAHAVLGTKRPSCMEDRPRETTRIKLPARHRAGGGVWGWPEAPPARSSTAERLLDIGSGIGSVGLLTLWRLGHGHLTSVEVQELSWRLAQKTIAFNALEDRVDAHLGDLRTSPITDGSTPFDLITGSPPYIPPDRGVQSPHPQKAAARIELHGDVFDYCAAAARCLAPGGRFVLCHAAADPRPEQAIEAAGLTLLARRDVVFRADQPPLIAIFTAAWEGARADHPTLIIRDDDGAWTDDYLAMRRDMGTEVWNRSASQG